MAHDQVHRIEDLSVAFISLVGAPANQRGLLVKSALAGQMVFERQVGGRARWIRAYRHDPMVLFFGLTQRTKGQDLTRCA